ncbi:unnamed protein product [Pieris brassicae]|uniref:VMP25 protein n=1 Tax=Pieris brassicae TaxID=7116 RepID=A0A9P0TX68_PIEBR|nr:unnamed protein product [Pieris brassicae]
MAKRSFILFSTFIVTFVQCGVVWETPSNLQPVHGLYVKPSVDGTTGDLYVAATEDNGVNSQWLTDQPINFLASASENHQLPLSFTSRDSDEVPPQKRAVLTTPIQFAQALPTETEKSVYHVPTSDEKSTPCAHPAPYYSPFQYFYPQMLSAIANAYTQKEGNQEAVKAQPTAWPHAYAYPFQYVMFDPRVWANQISSSENSKTTTKDGV